jgi:hypothetical protein
MFLALRNYLGPEFYVGIEFEINQEYAFFLGFDKAFSDVFHDSLAG